MRTKTPPFVGVSVQATTLFSPPRRLLARSVPAIADPLIGFDEQDLAVGHAVPMRHRRGAEIGPVADDRLEVVVHQPLLDQRALREGAPHAFRPPARPPVAGARAEARAEVRKPQAGPARAALKAVANGPPAGGEAVNWQEF
jgi:hypothetical protein